MNSLLPIALILVFGALAIWIDRRYGRIAPPRVLIGLAAGAWALWRLIHVVQQGADVGHVALFGALTVLFAADVIRGVVNQVRARNRAA